MKWLEIIELRTSAAHQKQLETHLEKLIDEVSGDIKEQAITVYERAMIDNIFSIHLFHDTIKGDGKGSELGLCIAASLKEYGLVSHSIWDEMGQSC